MTTPDKNLTDAALIETVRIEADGSIPLWPGHCARLQSSAWALNRTVAPEAIEAALTVALGTRPAGGPARWRLLLTPDGTLHGETAALSDTPEPVQIQLASERLESGWKWLTHKTTWRPLYLQAGRWLAAHPDVFDLVFLNERDELCEGSRSTIYLQDDKGTWLTPPLASGVLPGVYRQALLDSGQAREAVLTRHCLEAATRIRVSNALRGWLNAVLVKTRDGTRRGR